MKPFDDSIPEEIEPPHAPLVSMLQEASSHPVQLTVEEQTQLLERVHQRLQSPDLASSTGDEQAAGATGSIPPNKPATRSIAMRRGHRMWQFASMLAAVLVIAAISGAS